MIYKALLIICVSLVSFSNKGFSQEIAKGNTPTFPTINVKKLSYEIIPAPNNTYGYLILNAGKPFIKQTNIPGMAGINGFKTKQQAESTAKLVMSKMSQGAEQPTVTLEELKKINAIK